MTYQYARINLAATDYQSNINWQYLTNPNITELNEIYRTYCIYKRFGSVMPIFDSQYTDTMTDVIGYYSDTKKLVAFSLIKRFDSKNALCAQFAWTYHDSKTRLGINSLKAECAIYKQRGFDYLYLDQVHLYKQGFEGFELLGPIQ